MQVKILPALPVFMPVTFSLTVEQLAKLETWMAGKVSKYAGASGGRFVYIFCPTTLGLVCKVQDDIDKDEIDLTDYEGW